MIILITVLVALVLIGPLALRSGNQQATAATATPMRFGIAFGNELAWKSDAELRNSLDTAKVVGADWIRIDLDWSVVQPDGATSWQWQAYDRIVRLAGARQLKVIAVLAYAPRWAAIPTCSTRTCAPAAASTYRDFVQAAVARYAPQGVHTWEVWNEPNLRLFWGDAPDPAMYAEMLAAASEVIRRTDRQAKVLFGGLAVADSGVNSMDQLSFLARVAQRTPLTAVDAISYHPYTFPDVPSQWHPWSTSWQAMGGSSAAPWPVIPGKTLRGQLSDLGHADMPIWVTEYGAPTGGPRGAYGGGPRLLLGDVDHVSETQQARLATDAFRMSCIDPLVQAFVWYSERDRSFDSQDTENFFGLRRADGSAKPALFALRDADARYRGVRTAATTSAESAC